MRSRSLLAALASASLWSPTTRARLLRRAGVTIGRARVLPGVRFIGDPSVLTLGDGVFLNVDLLVGGNASVSIGDGTRVGPRCMLVPTTHELGPSSARAGDIVAAPIDIGPGCWIGAGVTILSGVTVGAGAVIAAGAVVTADCEPDALYGGVPAKLLRRL